MRTIVYKSQTIYEGADAVIKSMKDYKNDRCIVIVPDAYTLALESEIQDKLGIEGTFNIEVVPFSELALQIVSARQNRCLSPSGCVMLLSKVIMAQKDRLGEFHRAANYPEFASEMYAAITELRASGISTELLQSAMDKMPEGRTKSKLSDIYILYTEYIKALGDNFADGTSLLQSFCDTLNEESPLADVHYFIVDFCEFNAIQLRIVAKLMAIAKSISISVPYNNGENRRIYGSMYGDIIRMMDVTGLIRTEATYQEIDVKSELNGARKALADNMFAFRNANVDVNNTLVYSAASIESEVRFVATEILKCVRKEELKREAEGEEVNPALEPADFSKIIVVASDMATYEHVVDKVFSEYKIPYYLDKRYLLSNEPMFTHLLAALECKRQGLSRVALEGYYKHPLCCIDADKKDIFANYTLKYGVDYNRFNDVFTLADETDKVSNLSDAESVRQTIIKELDPILKAPNEATVSQYISIIESFWEKSNMDSVVKGYFAKVLEKDAVRAECLSQSIDQIKELFATIKEILGDNSISFDDFILVLTTGAEQVKIAPLPTYLNAVYLGSLEQAMYDPTPYLFIMGANDGQFPIEKTGEGIIGSMECAALQNSGLTLKNIGANKLNMGRFSAQQLVIRGDKLYIGYIENQQCSSVITQICTMMYDYQYKGKESEKDNPVKIFSTKVSDLLKVGSKRYSIEELIPTEEVRDYYLRRYSYGTESKDENQDKYVLKGQNAQNLFKLSEKDSAFKGKPYTSVSDLESYFTCPFQRFIQYAIGAKDKQKAELDQMKFGNIVHECLEILFKNNAWEKCVDDEALDNKVKEILDKILSDIRYKPILENSESVAWRITSECQKIARSVVHYSKDSLFRTQAVEAKFGKMSGPAKRIYEDKTIDLGGIVLTGKIDRIDGNDGNDVLAIDYKTGSAKGKGTPAELYSGGDIQLPLYMAVLKEAGENPIGSLYFGFKNAEENKMKTAGFVLREDQYHEDWSADINGAAIGVKKPKKSKEEGAKEGANKTYTEEGFARTIDYAVELSRQAVKEIKDGYILPSPQGDPESENSACAFCSCKDICRFSSIGKWRNVKGSIFGTAEEGQDEADM